MSSNLLRLNFNSASYKLRERGREGDREMGEKGSRKGGGKEKKKDKGKPEGEMTTDMR